MIQNKQNKNMQHFRDSGTGQPGFMRVNSITGCINTVFACLIFVFVLYSSCREKYIPQLELPASSFLVVEGFINSGSGPTTITLSRTTRLTDTALIVYETKALVRVEGKQNTTGILLPETSKGKYSASVTLNPNDQYRVYIKTANGKEYVSEYSEVRRTPDIDSVTWKQEGGGLQLYTHTHDPQGKTRYYQFAFEETWEFRSAYISTIKAEVNRFGVMVVSYRDSARFSHDTTMYKCWKSYRSANIITATSEQLTQDIIANKRLQFIEGGSYKLSQLYTMLVRQRAASKEGYHFLEQLKKNTEQLGSIFDAQPSDNNGNIRCITNASEIVIGFIEVSEEKQKRIWITRLDLPNWRWARVCLPEISILNHPDSLAFATEGGASILTTPTELTPAGAIIRVNAGNASCVDCRTFGGEPKPSFWP